MEILLFSEVAEKDLPTRAQIQALARHFRCQPEEVQWQLRLLALDCRLARQYCRWWDGLPDYVKAWSVQPMILSRADYAVKTGHNNDENGIIESAVEFGRGFGEMYRPIFLATFADPPVGTRLEP